MNIETEIEYWSWLLHDVADNMDRAQIYEVEVQKLAYAMKLDEWYNALVHITDNVKDQLEHVRGF